jgi:hypothetical protein
MGYTLIIDRSDRRPLGTIAEVQSNLERVFVGVQFGVQHTPPELSSLPLNKGVSVVYGTKPGLTNWIAYQIMSRITPPLRYPYVTGDFQGDGFSIEFQFGSDALIKRLPIEVYGTANIDQHFAQLSDATGWRVRKLRLLDLFVR